MSANAMCARRAVNRWARVARALRRAVESALSKATPLPMEALESRQLLSSPFTITEFMAANAKTLLDEDNAPSDWIEIHNSSPTAQSLAGFHLTDSAGNLTKWTFPNVQIAGNGNLVLFASGKDRTSPAGTLHTNFSLSANGDYLALVEPDGTTKDSEYNFGSQETDISYGIDPASNTPRFFATPTPGAANKRAEVVINEIHYQPDVKTELVEFVELYNPGSSPVDLSGASFSSGITYTFPAGSVLQPGKYLVLTENLAAFQAKFQAGAFGQFTGSLSNEADHLILRNASGGKLDDVDYQAGFPWPSVAATPGYSIQLINPDFDNSIGGNWRSAAPSVSATGLPSTQVFSAYSTWDYRKGTSEASTPTSAWKQINFVEDGSWVQNQHAPIGYDPSAIGNGTRLTDMRGNYVSVFMRKTFTIADPTQISALKLEAMYDDGFNVWINGVHVVRSPEMGTDDPAYNVSVGQDNPEAPARESSDYVTFNIGNAASFLVPGTNVIAVHFHNIDISNSSDAFFDARLTAIPAGNGTAGAQNAVYATNAPPLMRQVNNSPQAPQSNQAVTVTAKVTDTDGVNSVVLQYQVVDPGQYIAIEDAAYSSAANWTSLAMHDDGLNGDAVAGDSIYSAVIPASVQVNRRLVRYRVTSTDTLGNSITGPYADDTVPNFSYYVYDGVPAWSGARQPGALGTNGQVQTYSSSTLTSLPYIQLLTKKVDHDNAQHIPGATTGEYGGDAYLWSGTLVFNGVVYDNVHYRARGGVWRYAMGKNMWKFDFPAGHDFQMYNVDGTPLPTKWKKLNLGADIQQGDIGDRGEQGLFETLSFQLFNLAGVPAEATVPITFRIVENASPTGATQYDTDFQGLYLALEQPDGRFLDSHNLPDGNLYKMEGGTGPGGGTLNNQGPTQPSDNSDLVTFMNTLGSNPSEAWIRANIDLDELYSYKAIVEMIHHWDIGFGKNYYLYHNPANNKWQVVPWDTDLTWYVDYEPGGGDGTPFDSILSRAPFQSEYRNRVRELQDLVYSTGEVGKMADAYAALVNPAGTGPTLVQADAAMWDFNPIMTSSYVNSSKSGAGRFYQKSQTTKDFAGMVARLKSWQAGRQSFITNSVLTTTDENAAPRTPTATYTGPAGFALDALTFSTSAFQPGNQGGSFAAMKWRIADVTVPSTTTPAYEINAAWESGDLASFNPTISIPPTAVIAGHVYRVRVRMKDSNGRWSHWSAPVQFTASAAQSATKDSLRITELDYNPSPAPSGSSYKKDDFEFLELRNIGAAAINLQGVQLIDGVTFTFPDLLLNPGESCVVVSNLLAFKSRYYTAGMKIAGAYTGNLNNAGEQIVLKDALGQTIQQFTYGTTSPWPVAADGGGPSLVIKNANAPVSAWDDPASWTTSRRDDGTPGADESAVSDGAVVVNEVLSNSGPSAGDWIELRNTTDTDINIGGWWLSDTSADPAKYQIPANTIIPAHGFVTFDEFTTFGAAGSPTPFALNAAGDDVIISSATTAGVLTGYRQTVHFDGADTNMTLGRYDKPNGGTDFVPLTSATKGAANSSPVIGPVVISELMYSPSLTPTPGDEYIEIYNFTGSAVPLYDPAHPTNAWKLSNGVDYAFPGGAALAARSYALVVGIDPATFRSKYNIPASVQVFGPWTGFLENVGETVTLSRPSTPEPDNTVPYVPIDSINYGNAAPWPVGADGAGPSIGRITPTAYGNDPGNWGLEAGGGSPGKSGLDSTPPTVSIGAISTPRSTPVDAITVSFSEPVSGFDLSDLVLSRNGGSNLLTGAQTLTTSDNATFTLSNLTSLTWLEGNYTLTLAAPGSGIADLNSNALGTGSTAAWTLSQSALEGSENDDTWTVAISGGTLQIWQNVSPAGPATFSAPLSSITSLAIDGGQGSDSVTFQGDGSSIVTLVPGGVQAGDARLDVAGKSLAFAGMESLRTQSVGTLTLTTPNSSDNLVLSSPAAGQAHIAGDSSGAPLLPLDIFNTDTLIVDTGTNDSPGNSDTIAITATGLPASAVAHLKVNSGTGTDRLVIAGGTLDLDTNLGAGGGSLSVEVSGQADVQFGDSQTLAGLTVGDSARVTLQADGTHSLTLGALQLDGNGTLDLVNNGLILQYTDAAPESQLQQYVLRGLANGTGMIASHSQVAGFSQSGRVLAVFDNHDAHFSSFQGISLSNDWNQVLVKYTYLGDANADGKVDPTDYAIVDGLQGLGHSWITGDLNFDGKTTPDDYAQIDGNQGAGYGGAGGPRLSGAAPQPAASAPVVAVKSTASNSTRRVSPHRRLPKVRHHAKSGKKAH